MVVTLYNKLEFEKLFPTLRSEPESSLKFFFERIRLPRGCTSDYSYDVYEDSGHWVLQLEQRVPLERFRDIEDIFMKCRNHAETYKGEPK